MPLEIAGLEFRAIDALLAFVPIAVALETSHADPVWVFAASAIAIVPLAGWMGRATEDISEGLGAGVGGLLNATFGNAAELIIALAALRAGLHDMVKASLTGSIIGNILLVLGVAALAGGAKHERQKFNRGAASAGATLLALSVVGLVVPAIFHVITRGHPEVREQALSLEIAIVLFIVYLLSLAFSLRTHRHLYAGQGPFEEWLEGDEGPGGHPGSGAAPGAGRSHLRPALVLLVATALVAVMSEFLVGSVQEAAHRFGMTEVFVGVILVAIIGNAAEHSTAVLVAMKDKMDLAMNIAVGSSIQIALFVAPVLVFASYFMGKPMDLRFSTFEVVSVAIAVAILALISADGESHWLEGVQLIAVYLILGIAFYFLP